LNREVDRDKLAIALLHNLDRSYPGVATVRLG